MLVPAFLIIGVLGSGLVCVASTVRNLWLIPMALGLFIAFTLGAAFLYVLTLYIWGLCIGLKKKPKDYRPVYRWVTRETCIAITTISRAKVLPEGLEKMPEGRFVLLANHKSNLDPIITMSVLRKYPMSFLTKHGNMKFPIVGPFITKCNFLEIDRENPLSAIRTINEAAGLIKRDVTSFGIYPEGTRNKTDEILLPFHDGVVMAAQKANVPIVVLVTKNTEKIGKNFPWKRTEVPFKIIDVIPAEKVVSTRTNELSAEIRNMIESELKSK